MVSWYRRFCLSNYFRILTIRVADQLHFNADPFPLFALMRILIRIRFLMKVMGICDPRSTDPPRPLMATLESLQLLNFDFNADLDLRIQPFTLMRIQVQIRIIWPTEIHILGLLIWIRIVFITKSKAPSTPVLLWIKSRSSDFSSRVKVGVGSGSGYGSAFIWKVEPGSRSGSASNQNDADSQHSV